MKKLILTLAAILALVGVMISPMTVLAEDTVVTGTVAAIATVSSLNVVSGDPGTTTATITITGTGFDLAADPAPAVIITGADITTSAVIVGSPTSITTTFIIGGGAVAGGRTVTVNQGGQVGTVGATFTVTGAITVAAPTGGAIGYLTAGATKTASLTSGSVTTNYSTWSVTAVDAKVTNKGYMVKADLAPLAVKFQINRTASGYVNADTGFTYTQATDPGKTLPFFISQDVAAAATAGSYQITITFTGSGS